MVGMIQGMPEEPKDVKDAKEEKKPETYPLTTDQEPIVTEHRLQAGSKVLEYTVATGMLPLKDDFGETEAGIFFMAYTKKNQEPGKRPLMFCFNGGPGSSSVWLHLGALGPKRVQMLEDGGLPAAPYKLVDNPDTWLDDTDLVFVDPVGTGYSRPAKKSLGEKYWGLKGDIESLGEFIRLYLTRYERWSSPLFLVGESYGTTRSAGLAGYLIDNGVAFNGILLVSSILNFQTARFGRGNDLPNILFLPTYTATAWFHKKLSAELQKDLQATLRKVEEFAANEYTLALAKGDSLTPAERSAVIDKLSQFTGLSKQYIDNTDLRIDIHQFCKELCRDEKRTVGRLDSRFKGIDASAVTHEPDYDPSMSAIRPPYTSMLNDYVRRSLGYKTDVPYYILGGLFQKWDWGSAGQGHPDTSEALREAFTKNPFMKLFVASGYYDLATPYFATQYTLDHMGVGTDFRGNISLGYYEAGHMMYIHTEMLKKLKADVSEFIKKAL